MAGSERYEIRVACKYHPEEKLRRVDSTREPFKHYPNKEVVDQAFMLVQTWVCPACGRIYQYQRKPMG